MSEGIGRDVAASLATLLLPTLRIIELTDWRTLVPLKYLPVSGVSPTGGLPTSSSRFLMWNKFYPETIPYNTAIPAAKRFQWMIGDGANTVFLSTDNPTVDLTWDVLFRMLRMIQLDSKEPELLLQLQEMIQDLPPVQKLPEIRLLTGETDCWLGGSAGVLYRLLQSVVMIMHRESPRQQLALVHGIISTLNNLDPARWYALQAQAIGVRRIKISELVNTIVSRPAYIQLKQAAVVEWLMELSDPANESSRELATYDRAMLIVPAFKWLQQRKHPATATSHPLNARFVDTVASAMGTFSMNAAEPALHHII